MAQYLLKTTSGIYIVIYVVIDLGLTSNFVQYFIYSIIFHTSSLIEVLLIPWSFIALLNEWYVAQKNRLIYSNIEYHCSILFSNRVF